MALPAVRDFDIFPLLEAQLPRTLKKLVIFDVAADPYWLRTIVAAHIEGRPDNIRSCVLKMNNQGYAVLMPEEFIAELTLMV
jgi:hypothetical protein